MVNTRRRGYVLPGYKYLGPGNSLDQGQPTNESDRAARDHDIAYDRYLRLGFNPYTNYSPADERFLKRARITDYGGAIGTAFFYAKKGLAKAGVLGSLPDLQASAQAMPDGKGSGMDGAQRETPVDAVANVERGPPDYTFASLPWLERRTHIGENYHTYKYLYRMTSPYDCFHDTDLIDTNAGTGIQNERTQRTSDTSTKTARWFNFYAQIYNFYHVVSCRYHITLENLSTSPMWIHRLFVNDDEPPLSATNDDIRLWKGVKSNYVGGVAYAITSDYGGAALDEDDQQDSGMVVEDESGNANQAPDDVAQANYSLSNHVTPRGAVNIVKFSGEYRPGDKTREIHLDDQVELWTQVTTNPKLPERLCLLLRPDVEGTQSNSTVGSSTNLNYRLSVELEYLVEFKELKTGLRYPVTRQPLSVTINQDVVQSV